MMRYFVRRDRNGVTRSLHRFDAEAGISNRFDLEKKDWVDDPELIAFTGIGGDHNYFEVPQADLRSVVEAAWGSEVAGLALEGFTVTPGLRRIIIRGGSGSGNFGHEGRPGEVGGSAPTTGGYDSALVAAFGAETVSKMAGSIDEVLHSPGKFFLGVNKVYGPEETDSSFGYGDYWLLRDGTVVEVESHERAGKSALSYPGALPFGVSWDDVEAEGLLLGLGFVRWSTTGARGVSVGPMRMSDEQAGRVAEMARSSGSVETLLWESPGVHVTTSENHTYIGSTVPEQSGHGLAELLDVRSMIAKGGPGSGNYGHEGRPGEVGGSAPGEGREAKPREPTAAEKAPRYTGETVGGRSIPVEYVAETNGRATNDYGWQAARRGENLRGQLSAWDEHFRSEPLERATFITPEGQEIESVTGTENQTVIPERLQEIVDGGVMVHNHPRDRGPSLEDGAAMLWMRLDEVHAYSDAGRDYLRLSPSLRDDPDASTWLRGQFALAETEVLSDNLKRITEGKLTTSDADILHHRQVWTRIADRNPGLVDYYWEPRP